jgi:Ran GTPase-activating protein (RanGAP) involved in mRNA processing and transport
LENNSTIEVINLNQNNIDHNGIYQIFKGLEKNKTLKELYLRGNLVSRKGNFNLKKGSNFISHSLKINQTLDVLDISVCFIGHTGVTNILKSVTNKKLKLNTDGNDVREQLWNSQTHFIGIIISIIGKKYFIKIKGSYFLIHHARFDFFLKKVNQYIKKETLHGAI